DVANFFAAGQRVVARLELELQEVRRRHELWLAHLFQHVFRIGDWRRLARILVVRVFDGDTGRPDRDGRHGVLFRLTLRAVFGVALRALLAILLPAQPLL